jgi:hypothetical protein
MGDVADGIGPGTIGGQFNQDASSPAPHSGGSFDQARAQTVDLSVGQGGGSRGLFPI